MSSIDLFYEPESLLPPIGEDDIRAAEIFLSRQFECSIQFPKSYVEHMLQFHGGVPRKRCFEIPSGERRVICRFINFLDGSRIESPIRATWRGSRESDIRLDYSLYTMQSCDPWNLRLSESGGRLVHLVPIAALDTAGHDARGMHEFDLLCFDFEQEPEPSVVTWSFEMSYAEPEWTKFVAPTFADFLKLLHECPPDDPIANEEIDPEYF